MTFTSYSTRATQSIAKRLAKTIQPPAIFGLIGPLGAGKTVFVQTLAKALGVKEHLKSPTFVYLIPYQLPNNRRLIHVDAYRLESPQEAQSIGLAEALSDKNAVVVVEWADKISQLLPKKTRLITLNIINEKTREISID